LLKNLEKGAELLYFFSEEVPQTMTVRREDKAPLSRREWRFCFYITIFFGAGLGDIQFLL